MTSRSSSTKFQEPGKQKVMSFPLLKFILDGYYFPWSNSKIQRQGNDHQDYVKTLQQLLM